MVISALAVALSAVAWRGSGDLLIDFGREVYVVGRLADGAVLYRDVGYTYGPLSPYVNLVAWKVFGAFGVPGRDAIMIANAAVFAASIALLYHLLARLAPGDRYAPTLAASAFVVMGAIGANTALTNYNFLAPYAHPMTHGLLLCLAVTWAAARLRERPTARRAAALGALLGLAALTKVEITVAAAAVAGAGLLLALPRASRRAAPLAAFAATAALVSAAALLLLLSAAVPPRMAAEGMANYWLHLGAPYIVGTPFYREGLGTDFTARSAEKLLRYACLYLQFVLPLGLVALALRKRPRLSAAAGAAAAVGLFALGWFYKYSVPFWEDVARGLPLFPVIGAAAGLGWMRRAETGDRGAVALLFSVLAAALLAKMALNVKVWHYGFALAAPAAALGIVVAAGWLPALVRRAGGGNAAAAAIGITGPIVLVLVWYAAAGYRSVAARTVAVATPSGTFRVRPADRPAVDAAAFVRDRLGGGAGTLAAVPDVAGLNVAAGMPNPTRYDLLHAMSVSMYGGVDVVNAAYRAAAPDAVIVVDQDLRAFGSSYHWADSMPGFTQWLERAYEPAVRFGGSGQREAAVYLRRGTVDVAPPPDPGASLRTE